MSKEQVKKNPRGAAMTPKQDDHTPQSLELSEGQLEVHFRRLNLAHTRRIYKEVAVRAEKESWSYRDFLALLLAEEVARRKQTRLQRCTRSAHFPFFKTIDEFDFTLQSTLRESLIGSYLGLDFVTEGRSLILHGKTGRGKTHLAVGIGYRAIQNGFETLFTTAAELIEDLSNASKRGNLQESLTTYTHPHVLVIDEVGYLTYGPDAANVLFHVVNDRHLRKRPMIFTTNKPLNEWGKVLHDEDMAAAILDRVLERGRFIRLDGPSGRTRHLNLEETLPENTKRLRISGISGSEFPEPTSTGCKLGGRRTMCGTGPACSRLRQQRWRHFHMRNVCLNRCACPSGMPANRNNFFRLRCQSPTHDFGFPFPPSVLDAAEKVGRRAIELEMHGSRFTTLPKTHYRQAVL
jgi:DNA replication protein DnaC